MTNLGWVTTLAVKYIGLPYIWGGDDPIKGFDCSGFVMELLKAGGLVANNEDLTANGIFARFRQFRCSQPTEGALLFFGKDSENITHTAYALNDKLMLEAGGGGRKTDSAETAAAQNAYLRIRPIKNRSDLVAMVRPLWE